MSFTTSSIIGLLGFGSPRCTESSLDDILIVKNLEKCKISIIFPSHEMKCLLTSQTGGVREVPLVPRPRLMFEGADHGPLMRMASHL